MLLVILNPPVAQQLLAHAGAADVCRAPVSLFLRRFKVQDLHGRLCVDTNRVVISKRERDNWVAVAVPSKNPDAIGSTHIPNSNFAVHRAGNDSQTVELQAKHLCSVPKRFDLHTLIRRLRCIPLMEEGEHTGGNFLVRQPLWRTKVALLKGAFVGCIRATPRHHPPEEYSEKE